MQYLEYCNEEKELAASFAQGSNEIRLEIQVTEKEIRMHRSSCESVRMRYQADDLFTNQIEDCEKIDMRMMWTILDMYKEAVLLSQELDIENEACALSRLGRMYDKVFKIRGKSHQYYRRAFDLVQTLFPKDMSQVSWYTECKEALEKLQKNVVLEEQRRQEAERAPFLEKLKPQLEELREKDK